MEYIESPSIQEAERKHVYSFIRWLSKEKFLEKLSSHTPIHPFSFEENYSNSNHDESMANARRIYIGKTIPMTNSEETHQNIRHLELIGTVQRNLISKNWQLIVPYDSRVHVIDADFLVLSIDDPNSFYWQQTSLDNIPKHAMRGSIELDIREYLYIGKSLTEDNYNDEISHDSRVTSSSSVSLSGARYWAPRSEQNAYDWIWHQFTDDLPNVFGKIHVGNKCLYVPVNNREVSLQKYLILCMKPSPAPLQILCRQVIRSLLDHSQSKIIAINSNKSGERYIPSKLIDFLKYPSYLNVGEYMLKEEKIVDSNRKFELVIKSNGQFVCRSCDVDVNNIEKMDTRVERIIKQNVDSIWLHRFKAIFHMKNKKVELAKAFFNMSPDYTFGIEEDTNKPSFCIRHISSN